MRSPLHDMLLARLRADSVPASVPGSLPVLFFGDLSTARVATIGINPSKQEYLSPHGVELDGSLRRFESLRSLGVKSRADLNVADAARAVECMRGYFDEGKPAYSWFNGLARVVGGMGVSFSSRSAAHLDLVQEATDPVWSELRRADASQAAALLRRDLPFLRWQIEAFPVRALVCTSATVMREVWPMLGVRTVAEGTLARIRWNVGIADTRRGRIGVAGWNIPLARPTGLDKAGQHDLGVILADELAKLGCGL